MMYVAEIFDVLPGREFEDGWARETLELQARHGLASAELFARVESIRDANYTYVGLRAFRRDMAETNIFSENVNSSSMGSGAVETVNLHEVVRVGELVKTGEHDIWLINPFEISGEEIEGALSMWNRAKGHMIAHDGFVNARLLRAVEGAARYGLLNVSQWRSDWQFKAALADRAYDKHRDRSMNYRLHPSLCRRVFDLAEAGSLREN